MPAASGGEVTINGSGFFKSDKWYVQLRSTWPTDETTENSTDQTEGEDQGESDRKERKEEGAREIRPEMTILLPCVFVDGNTLRYTLPPAPAWALPVGAPVPAPVTVAGDVGSTMEGSHSVGLNTTTTLTLVLTLILTLTITLTLGDHSASLGLEIDGDEIDESGTAEDGGTGVVLGWEHLEDSEVRFLGYRNRTFIIKMKTDNV